jgi:hypothetical protein
MTFVSCTTEQKTNNVQLNCRTIDNLCLWTDRLCTYLGVKQLCSFKTQLEPKLQWLLSICLVTQCLLDMYIRALHLVFVRSMRHFVTLTVHCLNTKSRDCSVGIALGYGLDDRGSRVRFPAGVGNFSLHHRVQNGSGAHPASYKMGTRGSLTVGKESGEWSWPLTSTWWRGQECVELYLHSPIRLHGVVLS